MHIYLYMSGNFILYVDYKKIIKVTKKSKINVDTCNICKLKNLTPTQKEKEKRRNQIIICDCWSNVGFYSCNIVSVADTND